MNFLGHLYFSNNDPELMYANLFGDHVKGRDYGHYPEIVQKGISLHRKIDQYIDHHPTVIKLLHELYPLLPKISGIAVDLYFDHVLAKRWDVYHDKSLRSFVDDFYSHSPSNSDYFSTEFIFLIDKMKEFDWIYRYKDFDGLDSACNGLSRRMKFRNSLGDAPKVYLEKQNLIDDTFDEFMNEAIPYFRNAL